ncbi:putative pentatricopeptide repeat domain-containing protein [Eutypa lata UCREL1]|uniref:Putative pentatricopeptide repeat domain-containing protein n=1 Tax=Eutypa lata (strain UCR-EL1) TaxID=1287681 RepID=M7TL21_EUTLA|nr:putative pentatricopeptide repeat domain-containing protein [Eutypa lata UCREL1]
MPLAPRPFRDVNFHRFLLDLRLHLRPRSNQAFIWHLQLRALQKHGYATGTQPYSVAAINFEAVTDVPSPPAVLDGTGISVKSLAPPPNPGPLKSLTQHNELFTKWRALLRDSSRLAVETDFTREGPAKGWRSLLLVDKVEHRGDLTLWSCLFDYQARINGDLGTQKVWKALWGRKFLYDVESPLAPVFWQTILEAAIRSDDSKFLQSVYVYSEWMYATYEVKWPRLYSTIMTHFLRSRQHSQVLQWHLRLMPTFYPGPEEFAEILKQFASETELYRSFTLQSLYILNPNRQLYDKLVPYLYARGEAGLAISWRDVLIQRDDVPMLPVPVRPFLRYLQGYFPKRSLHPKESAAVSQDHSFAEEEEVEGVGKEVPDVSREFFNRVHGETFGISVKNYNDSLGSKWFASSWISTNTAISTVAALGIKQIGPLSLQSIALREESSEGVSKRINQLQAHGITVVDSNYLRILLYFVKVKDDELLFDLLQSDFHPDVFDDPQLLARLLETTMDSGDWRTYRLLLAARIIIMQKMTRESANAVLRACFLNRDPRGLFRALDDMRAMKIGIDSDQADLIFQSLYDQVRVNKFRPGSLETTTFYLRVCLRLVSMDVPVPVACWRQLLQSLGKQGSLDDLENLCLELVSLFTSSRSSSRPGFMPVHLDDIPEPMKQPLMGVENLLGVYVPRDLPNTAGLHPLHQIFDTKMIQSLVRWAFQATLVQPPHHKLLPARAAAAPISATATDGPREPRDFHCGRAVRLLSLLRDRGVYLRKAQVAKAVTNRLVDLYGTAVHTKEDLHRARANNVLSLPEMKGLLDRAWGTSLGLLPPLDELRAQVERRGRAKSADNFAYLHRMNKRPIQPRLLVL